MFSIHIRTFTICRHVLHLIQHFSTTDYKNQEFYCFNFFHISKIFKSVFVATKKEERFFSNQCRRIVEMKFQLFKRPRWLCSIGVSMIASAWPTFSVMASGNADLWDFLLPFTFVHKFLPQHFTPSNKRFEDPKKVLTWAISFLLMY